MLQTLLWDKQLIMKVWLVIGNTFWQDFRKAKHFILRADAQNKELKVLR